MKKTKIAANIFFIIGSLILAFMIYKIGLDVIWSNIKQTKWWFLAIIGTWVFVYLANTFSFRTIINDGSPEAKSIGFFKTYKLIISGYAINYITPFGLLGGEPYRIIKLKPLLGIQKATSSVLLYMMMHIVSHFIFWMISIPLLFLIVPNIAASLRIILVIAAVASLISLYWAFSVYSNGFIIKSLRLAARLPFVGKRIRAYRQKHSEKIVKMDELIADLYKNRKKDFFKSLSFELLSRYILCVEIIFMMHAIGFPVTYTQSVIIESIQSLVGNMFFFMPMQLGAREGGFLIVFSILSISAAHGVYVSLCMRIRELVWTLIGLGLIKVETKDKTPLS